ncbi:restriction endonuclease subunit S [bacterium]|nr:restriction endonuclease subunit S [Candidatus Micrarchaeota archaeon]MBU1626728.1 restriction endonuclease subunit S [bacterium]
MVTEAIKPGYKQTEVGLIPEDWEVKKLGECLLKNPDYGINAAAVAYNDNLPTYLRITDISEEGKYLSSDKVSVDNVLANSYYLDEGDIVFARTGASVGKTYLYNKQDGKLVFAGFLIRVKANAKILDCHYLIFLTQTKSYWNWVLANSMRSGQPGLNSEEYKSLQIPLPPTIIEQSAIAHVLSDTDAFIQSVDKLITKKKNIKQGAMQELLTGKKRLPEFKGGWETKTLGAITEIKKGELITDRTRIPGDIPVIAGGKTPAYYHSKPNRTKKTITVSCSGANAGYVSFHSEPIFASDCSTIEESSSYSLEFLYFKLLFIQGKIYSMQTGGAQPHIHPSDLSPLFLKMPKEINEQLAIAQVLSDMDAEIELLERKRDKYKEIKTGMMQELLTGGIRLNVKN